MASKQLAVGQIFSEIFRAYRDNAAPLLTVAMTIFLPLTLLTEIATTKSAEAGMAVSLFFSGSATFLYAAVVAPLSPGFRPVAAAADSEAGIAPAPPVAPNTDQTSISDLWAGSRPLIGSLLVAGFIYTLATSIGVMLLIVPGLLLVTIWAVAPAALRIEGLGALESLRRSQELVRGNGWRVFGLIICAVLLIFAGSIVLQSLSIAIAGEQTGSFIGSWLGVVVTAPLLGMLPTILYDRLRPE